MVKKKKAQAAAPNNSWIWLLLIVSLGGNVWQYQNREIHKDNPAPVVVDDTKPKPSPAPKPDAVVLKDCKLVTIADKSSLNEDPDYLITMQDDAFWDEMQTKLADVEHVDAKDDVAKKWIASASLTPPVVLLVNTNTKKVLWTMPLPKGGTKEIRAKLGQ